MNKNNTELNKSNQTRVVNSEQLKAYFDAWRKVIADGRLNRVETALMWFLQDCNFKTPHFSYSTLGEKIGHHQKSIYPAIKKLKELGYITTQKGKTEKNQPSTIIKLKSELEKPEGLPVITGYVEAKSKKGGGSPQTDTGGSPQTDTGGSLGTDQMYYIGNENINNDLEKISSSTNQLDQKAIKDTPTDPPTRQAGKQAVACPTPEETTKCGLSWKQQKNGGWGCPNWPRCVTCGFWRPRTRVFESEAESTPEETPEEKTKREEKESKEEQGRIAWEEKQKKISELERLAKKGSDDANKHGFKDTVFRQPKEYFGLGPLGRVIFRHLEKGIDPKFIGAKILELEKSKAADFLMDNTWNIEDFENYLRGGV